jgi:protein SCO1/2
MMHRIHIVCFASLFFAAHVAASSGSDAAVEAVGVDQHLGSVIPPAAAFIDEHGTSSTLARFLDGRPGVLLMGYNACPNLCSAVRASLIRALDATGLRAGIVYSVLAVSIDPAETSAMAATTRAQTLDAAALPNDVRGWHFLTGDSNAIAALAERVGFRYAYDAEARQFIHAAAIIVVTPGGVVSRYFMGVDYPPDELRRSLVDAAGERVGSPVRALLLRCFHYDPRTGKYSLTVEALARALGIATLAALGALVFAMSRSDAKRRRGAG